MNKKKKVKCKLVSIDTVKILNNTKELDNRPFHILPCIDNICPEGQTEYKIFIDKIYTSGLTDEEESEIKKIVSDNTTIPETIPETTGGKSKSRRKKSNKKKKTNKKRSTKRKSNKKKRKTHRR